MLKLISQKANFYRGNNHYAKKEYDKAIELYKKAIAINPKDTSFYYNLGLAYYEKKEYDKAIESYNKAIAINPKDADFEYLRKDKDFLKLIK